MTTGTYWLAATGVVLLLWLAALANSATNNYILAFDLTLLDWASQLRTLVLTDVMRGVHALGSLWTVRVLFWATMLVLPLTCRFRHLFVFLGAVVGVIALSSLLAYLFMLHPVPSRSRSWGDWTGAAHPSRPVAVFTAPLWLACSTAWCPRADCASSASWSSPCWSPPCRSPWPYLGVTLCPPTW